MTIGGFWLEVAFLTGKFNASVTSGHRTVDRNRLVGGAPDSMHLAYKAADLVLDDNATKDDLILAAKGAGLFVLDETAQKNHIHLDDRFNT